MPTVICAAENCEHNSAEKCTCATINLDDDGTCEDFEEREEEE